MVRRLVVLVAIVALAAPAFGREMTSAYVITAVANKAGVAGTDWHSDLTLYNPHNHAFPVKLYFLPSGQDNSSGVPMVAFSLQPWETLNLWDVLGPNGFDARGQIGAMLVEADADQITCPDTAGDTTCDFAAFARNYTPDPTRSAGEYGQDFPGFPANLGVDSTVIAYMPQISDDGDFRTNVGVVSLAGTFVTVRFDIQDRNGNVLGQHYDHVIAPFGHAQWRLEQGVTGGTVAAYVVGGPTDALVFPYATVVNWATGDATTVEAQVSTVGLTAQAASVRAAGLRARIVGRPVPSFSLEALQRRAR